MQHPQPRPNPDWPYLEIQLPGGLDEEQVGCLIQAAVERGALGAAAEGGRLWIYLPREAGAATVETVRAAVEAEAALWGLSRLSIKLETLADAPWATAWRVNFNSRPIGRRLLVRPDWEKDTPSPPEWMGRTPIWIRPGAGFGTGTHETTRLALQTLERHLNPGVSMLDFGSGSGILSIAAVALGAAAVTAIEMDPEANANARENIELNACGDRITLIEASDPDPAAGPFDWVVCNMLPQNALARLPALAKKLDRPESRLIYSGFLADQKNEIQGAFETAGLQVLEYDRLNDWGMFVGSRVHESVK